MQEPSFKKLKKEQFSPLNQNHLTTITTTTTTTNNNLNNNMYNNLKMNCLVQDIMSKEIIKVKPDTTLSEAIELLVKNNIHRLPVVNDEDKIVGIVTDRDLRLATNSPFLGKSATETFNDLKLHQVKDIMHEGSVLTVEEDAPIVEAAKLMRVRNVTGLPVVNKNGDMVGMISRSDLIDQLIRIIEPLDSIDENKINEEDTSPPINK